jgi:cytochrome c-type biogenesis protein CcmH/NrfG
MKHTNSSTPQGFFTALNAMTGIAGILLGVITGYVIGAGRPAVAVAPAATSAALPQDHPTAVVTEADLRPFREMLAADPKNARAAIEIANRLYDAGRYAESVPFYRQANTLQPKDVNVSTDLATALYYSGDVEAALTQFDRSLAIDPVHGQTLFNIGIVRRDGKKDIAGAVQVWEKLLAVQPNYQDAERVRTMLSELKAQSAPGTRSN